MVSMWGGSRSGEVIFSNKKTNLKKSSACGEVLDTVSMLGGPRHGQHVGRS